MVLALLFVACNGDATDDNGPTDTSTTGTEATTLEVEDVYVQQTIDPVDFLWVLDPTWRDGFDGLSAVRDRGYDMLRLAGADFRMGFTTADVQNPSTRGLIRGEHETIFPPNDTWFLPAGDEFRVKALDGILLVFDERFESNEDFFREDAHLHIMILTNTSDRSDVSLDRFKRLINDPVEEGVTLSVRVSAIVSGNEQIRADWEQLTDELGGITYHAGSWERGIEEMYLHGINQLREFPLTEFPLSAPREVIVTFRERNTVNVLNEDFEYIASRNRIRFIFEPPEVGSTIRIPYNVPLQ